MESNDILQEFIKGLQQVAEAFIKLGEAISKMFKTSPVKEQKKILQQINRKPLKKNFNSGYIPPCQMRTHRPQHRG